MKFFYMFLVTIFLFGNSGKNNIILDRVNITLKKGETAIILSGPKAVRNNNPGNITCMSGNSIYGSIGIAYSNYGDKGDRAQCVYATPEDGFEAMNKLLLGRYSKGPIKVSFRKYQTDMVSFRNKLKSLKKAGININLKYKNLSKRDRRKFLKIWSAYEGYDESKLKIRVVT